jgi:hypothetical protein
LFLDFENMDFRNRITADNYFSWNPVSSGSAVRRQLSWINVVNCGDPIATAFPVAALDLSVSEDTIAAALEGGTIAHRFFGPAAVASVGAAHTEYLNDKKGFLRILLRATGLAPGDPKEVASTRSPADHWLATRSVLGRLEGLVFAVAVLTIGLYCGLIARALRSNVAWWFVPLFIWPPITIGVLAFFQRLMLGGPTKRITAALIRGLKWFDGVSFPYRLRDALLRLSPRQTGDLDPMAPSPGYLTRLMISAISFIPTFAAMALPIVGTLWWTRHWPTPAGVWARVWSFEALLALACFMVYVISCAIYELVRTWRQVLRLLT